MGIRDRPTSPRSPWQNDYAERLIGSIRPECVDHVVVLAEWHLRHVLLSDLEYYNEACTHLSLNKDAPIPRAVQAAGRILCRPILADCITNTGGSDFRQGQGSAGAKPVPPWAASRPGRARRRGTGRKFDTCRIGANHA
jgi:hypothetical protein